jgi:hypothetical protein
MPPSLLARADEVIERCPHTRRKSGLGGEIVSEWSAATGLPE